MDLGRSMDEATCRKSLPFREIGNRGIGIPVDKSSGFLHGENPGIDLSRQIDGGHAS
jgi:hypothetical protein